MIKDNICPVCKTIHEKLSNHVSHHHPDYSEKQRQLICELYKSGMTAEKIAERPDIIYAGKSGVVKIIAKNFTKEEIEANRVKNIKSTLKDAYAAGVHDDIIKMNIERVKSEEGRKKNSEGLKRAYDSGDRVAWMTGLNKYTDERIADRAKKVSKTMRAKAERGELTTLLKCGPENPTWKEDRESIARRYRERKDFSKKDKDFLFERAGFRCEKCGIHAEILKQENNILNIEHLKLECDHIIPIKDGGEKDWEKNGQVLCYRCHKIKSRIESSTENILDIESTYDSIPVVILNKLFDGKLDQKYSIWHGDNVSAYIAPLRKVLCDDKFLFSDLKEKYPNSILFYSDEWYRNRDIALSMIKNRLGFSKSIYARKTKIIELSKASSDKFFQNNHISGAASSIYSVGLEYDGELVCAISFRKPFIAKHGNKIEIARFASKINCNVIGGFSKLLSAAIPELKKKGFSIILTYADLRFGTGKVYELNGFKFVGETDLDYFYTDGYNRFNRFRFRAKDGKSEKQVAEEAGVHKVYGCGSNIYEMCIG